MMPMKEDVVMSNYNQNVLTALCGNKSETSLDLQNMYTLRCGQISPSIRKLSKLESLNANTVLCENNFERLPKSKLKPVFNKTVHKQLDEICRIESEELNIRLHQLLSLRNEIYAGSEKVSKGRETSKRGFRKSSIGVKSTESHDSSHAEGISGNRKILPLTSHSLKGEPTNKSSIQTFSVQKKSLGNSEQNVVANNRKTLPDALKKKQKKNNKNQHKIYNVKINNYTRSMYPSICIGHRHCIDSAVTVPKKMGWLWNITDDITGYQPHPTWRPGAVPKSVSKIIKHSITLSSTPVREPFTTVSKRMIRGFGLSGQRGESSVSEIISGSKPLLHLHETKDVYCVNMCPLHEDYLKTKDPINFKIRKYSDNETISSSDLSLEVDMIVPDEPHMKSEPAKEKPNENMKQDEEIKINIPIKKKFSDKKKKNKKSSKKGKKT